MFVNALQHDAVKPQVHNAFEIYSQYAFPGGIPVIDDDARRVCF